MGYYSYSGRPVDLNSADVDELTEIPDLSEAKARYIVRYRDINGPYRSVEDVIKVPGIGYKQRDILTMYVYVLQPGETHMQAWKRLGYR